MIFPAAIAEDAEGDAKQIWCQPLVSFGNFSPKPCVILARWVEPHGRAALRVIPEILCVLCDLCV